MAKSKSKVTKISTRSKKEQEEEEEEDEKVDYADAADAYAEETDESEQEEQSDEEGSGDENDDSEVDEEEGDEDDEEDEDEDDEEEEEDDVAALFKGSVEDGEEEQDDDDNSADGDEAQNLDTEAATAVVKTGPEHCNFDLRNMTVMNSHQIPASSLYVKNGEVSPFICIPDQAGMQMNEDFLLERASAGCSQLIAAIWQLPTETSDAGLLAALPGYDEIPIPRAMPPPPPKQETKWEKFAKAKGIPLNKEKSSRKVWDEEAGTWKYRHGYEKANSSSKEWPIMEVGANDDPYADPWEKLRDAKKARTEKNLENHMKNQESVGQLAKGTTNRILKSRDKTRQAGKAGGNADRDNVLPVGVPVDLKGDAGQLKLRGKASTTAALEAVQRSTASLGKFDKVREGEPERKKTLSKMKKRKYDSATDRKVINTEGQKSMKILDAVINGGGMAKERAIRKGQFAGGETAYDYEYNDGLGASSFKKKKGRAGVGKNKKMTKKRAK